MMSNFVKISTHFLILLSIISQLEAYNVQKCSACEAVADQLSIRLANERPRNHLDARHRLDAEGKRYGKVIDFAISELRVIELIEDLCDEMEQYQLDSSNTHDNNEQNQRWILNSEADNTKNTENSSPEDSKTEEVSQQLIKEQRRVLKNACSDIIGDWEDDIAAAITSGKANTENVSDVLCVELGKYCPERSKRDAAENTQRSLDEL